jgi:hypothetical protein
LFSPLFFEFGVVRIVPASTARKTRQNDTRNQRYEGKSSKHKPKSVLFREICR